MKKTKAFYSFLLVYVFNYLNSPVYSNPTGRSLNENVELVEADIKNIDTTKFDISTFPDNPEVHKIAPKINKVIKIIKIDEYTLWEITPHSRCLSFLTFTTNSDKIFIVLHTSHEKYKYFTNLVYDPMETAYPGTSGVESIPKKIKYIGIAPFIIELNREFGRYNEYEKEIWGTKLSIEDIFDKWYFKHSSRNIRLCGIRGRNVLKYDRYEPNDCERFLKVTDKHGTIWSSEQESETRLQPCKRAEVYRDFDHIKLIRLTLSSGSCLHFKYNIESKKWNRCEQTDFEETLSEIGFADSMANSEERDQSSSARTTESHRPGGTECNVDKESGKVDVGLATASIDTHGSDTRIKRLDIAEIDTKDYHFIKSRLSSYRILTIIPREKRHIDEMAFGDANLYPVNSDDYQIILMKHIGVYYIEILLKDTENNYLCLYCDKILNQPSWFYWYQFIFYQQLVVEVEKYDIQSCIKYKHFHFLDELIEKGDPTTNRFLDVFPFKDGDKGETSGGKVKIFDYDFPYTVRLSDDGNEVLYIVGE